MAESPFPFDPSPSGADVGGARDPEQAAIDAESVDPDAALMIEAARGSPDAFATLVARHQKPLLNFFCRMGASHDCEDLVQETFLRIYRYRDRYKATARFSTFLYHLARHVHADRLRKLHRNERLATALLENAAAHGTPAHSPPPGQSMDVQAALDQLSPKLRDTLVLNIYQGLRYQEVAEILDIPVGTVKSRINLAIAALKEILHEK